MRSLLKMRIKNFRSLRDVEVDLQPLNVLVGPNAAGKSNFLDAIRFLGDAARDDLRPALAARGGYEAVCFRGQPANGGGIEMHIEAVVTKHASERAVDAYTLRFSEGAPFRMRRGSGKETQHRVLRREEELRFKRTKGQGRRITIQGKKFTVYDHAKPPAPPENLLQPESLALSTLPRLAPERGGEQVGTIAELFSTFVVFEVDVAKARRPSPLHEGDVNEDGTISLYVDASNLAAFLYQLKGSHEGWFDAFEDDARAMIPGYKQIHFKHIGGAEEAVAVEIEETGLRGRTPLAQASYGSVRALSLLSLLYETNPTKLTCVEEIDHGLHPHVFDRLVDRLRWASERTQFLIVTHSPALVNRLHASELIVCERDANTGETHMPAIATERVRAMEEALEGRMGLGELWFTGTLGGVP